MAGGGRKRHSQFTFYRPSDPNLKIHGSNISRESSQQSRSTKKFSESPQRKDRGDISFESANSGSDNNETRQSWLEQSLLNSYLIFFLYKNFILR